MDIDRLQGLIDLYLKAGKSRSAVLTMADYFSHQGLMDEAGLEALGTALDAQDKQEAPLDIAAALSEWEALKAQVESLTVERNELASGKEALKAQVEALSGPGKLAAAE